MGERALPIDVDEHRVIDLSDPSAGRPDRGPVDIDLGGPEVLATGELPSMSQDRGTAAAATSWAKRGLDIALSSFMLVLAFPVVLLITVAIKLDDGGPVLYRQERWGSHRRLFRVFKFRTMVVDSDARYGIRQAAVDDARITRVGRVLRTTGLDELPQLLNILRGEMSFVGPRPLALGELIEVEDGNVLAYEEVPGFLERLRVRPGLTGLATVHLPKDAHPLVKLRYDHRYIEEWSFWGDVKLIIVSFLISFRGRWETREKKLARLRGNEKEPEQQR
jgi:lipopolysaccharide/colanic/teichoic acid biosynthesis glycosyltransferase